MVEGEWDVKSSDSKSQRNLVVSHQLQGATKINVMSQEPDRKR